MIGSEGRHDYSAIGTVANLASRLANEANGGQILVIEKHAKNPRATFAAERGRPRRVEWCEASDKRWDEVSKQR
jgi:class 3 adenylate cyclase